MIQRVKNSFHNDILFAMVCLVLYFQQILHQKKMRFYKIKKKNPDQPGYFNYRCPPLSESS